MKLVRSVVVMSVALFFAPLGAQAATVIRLDLPDNHSRFVVKAMKTELARIVSDAAIDLQWHSSSTAPEAVDGRIFSVALRGTCAAATSRVRDPGPLGWTQVVDGRVLPYIEIDCRRVRALLEAQLLNESEVRRELYVGKALARVLAHELVHAMTRTMSHSAHGLLKIALNPTELTRGKYKLARADFEHHEPVQIADARVASNLSGD